MAGLSTPANHRDVADLRALSRHAVPDLSVDGQRRADAVAAADKQLRARRLVLGDKHLRRKKRTDVVLQHGVKARQLFKLLAERIIGLRQRAEAVAHNPAVFRGDASHRDAEPDHGLPPDSVLFHQLQQSLGEPLGGRFRRRSGLQRYLFREDHTAVQPDAREDCLAKVDQDAEAAGHLRVEVDQDLPPAGVAAAEHLAFHQQAVRDHLADDLGDGRRGQVHVLREAFARHGALLMENPQRRAPVAALHAH